jgi:hypothetical protein
MVKPSINLSAKGILVMLASYNFIWGLLLNFYPKAYLIWVGAPDTTAAIESAISLSILYLFQALFFALLPIFAHRHIAWLFIAVTIKVSSIVATFSTLSDIATSKKLYFQVATNDALCFILLLLIIFQHYSTAVIKK